ncbi:MAG: cytochrome-c peroxidase, partial [Acidobacteria bacterium]|nr:cytochrome-c peroxidase [Acidobacteriota bacterium]
MAPLVALALLAVPVAAQLAPERQRPEVPLGLDLYMPVPEDNPLTREKVTLGRRLFSDTILSRDRRVACVTCHEPERAFTDGRPVAVGIFGRTGTRNVPTLVNRGYGATFFWDGRIASLEAQVLQPIQDRKEMDLTVPDVLERLQDHRQYPALFQAAFGRTITADDLGRALASYVRTILSGNSRIDRYMNGDRDALSAQARRGLTIFRGQGNCATCHVGPTLTDER